MEIIDNRLTGHYCIRTVEYDIVHKYPYPYPEDFYYTQGTPWYKLKTIPFERDSYKAPVLYLWK